VRKSRYAPIQNSGMVPDEEEHPVKVSNSRTKVRDVVVGSRDREREVVEEVGEGGRRKLGR